MKGEVGGGDLRSFTEQQGSPPWSFRSAPRAVPPAGDGRRVSSCDTNVWAGRGLRCHPAEASRGDGHHADGSRTTPSLWAAGSTSQTPGGGIPPL